MRDSKRDTDVKNGLLDSVGKGEGGMIWEKSPETRILSYVKQIASPGSMHKMGCSGLVALGWPWGMGWGGRWEEGSGWGTRVHPWLIHVDVLQKPPQYCKAISLQIKKKKKEGWLIPCVVQYILVACLTHSSWYLPGPSVSPTSVPPLVTTLLLSACVSLDEWGWWRVISNTHWSLLSSSATRYN